MSKVLINGQKIKYPIVILSKNEKPIFYSKNHF